MANKASKTSKPEKQIYCLCLPPQIGEPSDFSSSATTLASAAMTPVNLTRPSFDLKKDVDNMKIEEIGPSRFGSFSTFNRDRSANVSVHSDEKKDLEHTTIMEDGANPSNSSRKRKSPVAATIIPLTEVFHPLPLKKRVDYLAGLISFSTLIATLIHFTFTFVPAVGMPGEPFHYRSEVWANKIIAPFLLNQVFVGVFFITSTCFLIEKYLKKGDLLSIAEKTTGRPFRVIIPIAAIAMLEYFLIDCGAIKWLEYLPSVTWSTWPYAVEYTDFAHYLSEILELVYLIPNVAPQITYNYCTGVLWTIPVQLQGSWQTLLGTIVVYEIQNPWKRMLYYTFCIITNWYAQSWGTFFWFGILLADLKVTYK